MAPYFNTTISPSDTWSFISPTYFKEIHVDGYGTEIGVIYLNGVDITTYFGSSGSDYNFLSGQYLLLDASNSPLSGDLRGPEFIATRSSTIIRDLNGFVQDVIKTDGRTINISRDTNNYITQYTDSINTWIIGRDINNYISGVDVI